MADLPGEAVAEIERLRANATELPSGDAVLGRHIAQAVRAGGVDAPTRRALHRVYDNLARRGFLDWGMAESQLLPLYDDQQQP